MFEAAVEYPADSHIADATAAADQIAKARAGPLLLATRYTMEQEFYKGRLKQQHGIEAMVPDDAGRTTVHDIIYDELCQGIVSEASKARYLDVVGAATREGADSVIFGCTEVGLADLAVRLPGAGVRYPPHCMPRPPLTSPWPERRTCPTLFAVQPRLSEPNHTAWLRHLHRIITIPPSFSRTDISFLS